MNHSLRYMTRFYLDEEPIRLKLRCKTKLVEFLQRKASLQISKDMQWDGMGWKWTDVWLDKTLSEEELTSMLDASYRICLDELSEHDLSFIDMVDQSLTMSDALSKLTKLPQLTHKQDEIELLIQPAILLRTSSIEHEEQLSPGQSKIGGLPDLPIDWDYPHFDGKPLAFLAQINLAEIPESISKTPLPSTGILYFFSAFAWQLEDGDIHPNLDWTRSEEAGFSQVLYFTGTTALLQKHAKPDGIKTFKSATVSFIEIPSLPRASDYARDPMLTNLDWTEQEFERFDNLYFDFSFVLSRFIGSLPQHKLLGYPDPIQSELTQADTRLLCQIDSDYHNLDTDMMWSDGGMIYFLIPKFDLGNMNFTNISSDSQSG